MFATALALLFSAAPPAAAEPKVHRDIAYAATKNPKQTLDVYAPAEGTSHPIFVWIHGGGWQSGDKKDVDLKPAAFVGKGYVFVSVNYRLLPDATIAEMAGDVAGAVRYMYDHAGVYGGDPATLMVGGHSAGAQLAALVCTDARYLKAAGRSLADVKACVPVDGDTYDVPLQIRTVEQRRKDIYRMKFGAADNQALLSPVTHAGPGKAIPPVLILHVAGHPETQLQSERLVTALRAAGAKADAHAADGKTHATINSELGKSGDAPTVALFEFLQGVRKK